VLFRSEQFLNGLQLSATLFLVAAGLTLIFGVMGLINLAHGSLYMAGAYCGAAAAATSGSFLLGLLAALCCSAALGLGIEVLIIRRLYGRHPLDQVLATFALVLIIGQATTMLFGRQPLIVAVPAVLDRSVALGGGLQYPLYRLLIIGVGLTAVAALWAFIQRTRIGVLIRAGATHRDMVRALGVDIGRLYTLVFAVGATLAGLAGFLAAPIVSVQAGMGEQILIVAFVVVVVGGLGSIRGAFYASLLLGLADTGLRVFLPGLLRQLLEGPAADALGAGLSSIGIYLVMALVLLVRPRGLFEGSP